VRLLIKLKDNEFKLVADYIYQLYGINLYAKQFLVESKISMLCFKLKLNSLEEFFEAVRGPEKQKFQQLLIDYLTTNYTFFYREPEHFQLLAQLLEKARLPVHRNFFNCWCAGCSTGAEPYTLTMALEHCRCEARLEVPYHVLATDVSSQALQVGLKGFYRMSDYVRLPEPWKKLYCHLVPGGFEIRNKLRQQIEWRQENLLAGEAPANKYDLILCRNVLIYFDEASRKKLTAILYRALVPGGYLFISHAEVLPEGHGFRYLEPSVYQKAGVSDNARA